MTESKSKVIVFSNFLNKNNLDTNFWPRLEFIYHYRTSLLVLVSCIIILHGLNESMSANILPLRYVTLQIMIILDFYINFFLLFVTLFFILLLKFMHLLLKHVFHYLNVAKKCKIHETISSRNHSSCILEFAKVVFFSTNA